MMKTVRISDNVVVEIIPEYAMPVDYWYGPEFAAQCVEATDEVEQRWVYDPETQRFFAPQEPEKPPVDQEPEDQEVDIWNELDAAYQEGVDSI